MSAPLITQPIHGRRSPLVHQPITTARGVGDQDAQSSRTVSEPHQVAEMGATPHNTESPSSETPRTPTRRKKRKLHSGRRHGSKKNSRASLDHIEESSVPSPPGLNTVNNKRADRTQPGADPTPAVDPKHCEESFLVIIKQDDVQALQKFIRDHRYEVAAIRCQDGLTPLLAIVRQSPQSRVLDFIESILQVPDIDINAADKSGRTALHNACCKGLLNVAERLIQKGAQIDACDNESATPLHLAVQKHHPAVVKLLITKNANPNAATFKAGTSTTMAKGGRTPLHLAAADGDEKIMKILLSARHINLSPRDYCSGLTPLHEACLKCDSNCDDRDDEKHAAVAQLLIDSGADINATTEEKYTPLHLAASSGRVSIVAKLMRAGADPSRYTCGMENAESLAPDQSREEITKLLHQKHRASVSRAPIGARLEVSQPRVDQEATCKDFTGFVWPSLGGERAFDMCDVWDLLYRPMPKLSQHKKTIWIHLPSNNVR